MLKNDLHASIVAVETQCQSQQSGREKYFLSLQEADCRCRFHVCYRDDLFDSMNIGYMIFFMSASVHALRLVGTVSSEAAFVTVLLLSIINVVMVSAVICGVVLVRGLVMGGFMLVAE